MGQVFRLYWFNTSGVIPVLIPDLWGKSSDPDARPCAIVLTVLIPDLWGKSSDEYAAVAVYQKGVLIPDLWGKSSDELGCESHVSYASLNPRFVGQVFRQLKDKTMFAKSES